MAMGRLTARHFSNFLDGSPGVGLLILRGTIGTTLGVQGVCFLTQTQEAGPREWMLAFLAVLAAVSFVLGLYTTIAASIVVIGASAAVLSIVSLPPPTIFTPRCALIYAMAISAALILLGPGAFSLDAKIFGRREIVIPKKIVR